MGDDPSDNSFQCRPACTRRRPHYTGPVAHARPATLTPSHFPPKPDVQAPPWGPPSGFARGTAPATVAPQQHNAKGQGRHPMGEVISRDQAAALSRETKAAGKTVVLTNG